MQKYIANQCKSSYRFEVENLILQRNSPYGMFQYFLLNFSGRKAASSDSRFRTISNNFFFLAYQSGLTLVLYIFLIIYS